MRIKDAIDTVIAELDLNPAEPIGVEVRTNAPESIPYDDMLFGYFKYIPATNKIISVDSDDYFIEEEIYKYELAKTEVLRLDFPMITVWINSEWMEG